MFQQSPFIGDWHRSIKSVKTCRLPSSSSNSAACNASALIECRQHEIDLMMNKVRHVNIVRGIMVQPDFLLELAKENHSKMPILITTYCDGGNLRRQLNDNHNANGMCETDIRQILYALKNAIFYLHSLSIIHRDIKPESVVTCLMNDGQRVYKLTDAGNSRPIDFHRIETGQMAYTAPELIINRSEKYGNSVDYWSLGILAYEISTGQRPFVPHLSLAQWVLRVRAKKSQHITISEDDSGDIKYSNRISPENQLTNRFASGFEEWLRLALEWNSKQRGYKFQKPPTNGNSIDTDNVPLVQVLKFFDTIDELLAKKLLTVFILTNHKYVSMEVQENTNIDEFYACIESEASISPSKCQIIWRKPSDIDDDAETMSRVPVKPIDFYVDDYFDKPMIYVTQTNDNNSSTEQASNVPAAELPMTVQHVLSNHDKPLKLHTLRKFARDALHLVRRENKTLKLCLDGWFYYAVQLNAQIELCQLDVKRMQCKIYGVSGAFDIHTKTLEAIGMQSNDGTWFAKYAQNIERLVTACDKISIRQNSLYRRSREICQHELLVKRDSKDFYDINNCTKAYDTLCEQIARNSLPPKPHAELYQCICKCLKQRDTHLTNKTFIEMQRNLNCIHIEYIEIKKALEKAIIAAERYRTELIDANRKLHECIRCIAETPSNVSIATSTTDLIQFNTIGTDANAMPSEHRNDFVFIGDVQQQTLTGEHMTQTKSIIEDNINLRISIFDVMNEIDEELKRNPN